LTAMRRLTLLVALASGALAAGCYNPKIDDGTFSCGPNGLCPDGFSCQSGRCFKGAAPGGGTGGTGGNQGGTGGTMAMGSGGVSGTQCPICTAMTPPPAGWCDPICQAGCPCGQKCVPGTSDAPRAVCVDAKEPSTPYFAACAADNDTCKAGSVCLTDRDDHPECGAHCFRLCDKRDADCGPNARCLDEIDVRGTEVKYGLCSSELDECNPVVLPARCMRGEGRPAGVFACYVLSLKEPDLTVCECAGRRTDGMTCRSMHDCAPGFECITKDGASVCRQLCTPDTSVVLPALRVVCKNPLTPHCTKFANGTRFGYCLP
jgi:hypothetical protein